MKLSLASAAPVFLLAAFAATTAPAQPAPAPNPAPQASTASQAPVPGASAPAGTATPRDPKSPVAGVADGRGPTGPVQISIVSPKPDEVIPIPPAAAGQPAATGAPVEVRVQLSNYEIFQDPKGGPGQHVAIVLDNLPYFAYPDLSKPWVFKKVPKGTHTIRVYPVRPWGESIKEPGAFAMVTFSVGEKDGKNTPVPGAPLLTPVRPKGKYAGAEAQKILFDFYVTGCQVAEKSVPNTCRVRYRLDDRPEVTLDRWEPMWWEGLAPGKHEFVIGLTREEKVVENGPFNLVKASFEIEPAGAGAQGGRSTAPGGASTVPGTAAPATSSTPGTPATPAPGGDMGAPSAPPPSTR